MHMMRSIPTSATTTRQEYDVYKLHTPHATPEAHERMTRFYRKVVDEDFALCEHVQKNLARGIFEGGGPLHPFHEEGVFAFQKMLLGVLRDHVDREKVAGREIWPARPSENKGRSQTDGALNGNGESESHGASICEVLLACNGDKDQNLQW